MKNQVLNTIVFIILWLMAAPLVLAGNSAALHPHGDYSPEEIRRRLEFPKETLVTEKMTMSPEKASLVAELGQAKKNGWPDQVLRLEEQLANLRGTTLEFQDKGAQGRGDFRIEYPVDNNSGQGGEKWLPHEYLLAGTDGDEYSPQMVADVIGVLYCAYSVDTDLGQHIELVKSRDSGEHWEEILSIYGPNAEGVSLALGEGTEKYLFLCMLESDNSRVIMVRVNLNISSESELTYVYDYYPDMLANPRIASDTDEYDNWYIYLVFNVLGVDNWTLATSRTIDFGETWTTVQTIEGYCGFPGNFYDGLEAKPDIDFGSGYLYVAFDNYPAPCSSTDRDIFILTSTDFGSTWSEKVQVSTSYNDDEYSPAIGAMRGDLSNPAAAVAWTRNFGGSDHDVWYNSTQDGGVSWDGVDCIACSVEEEGGVNLASSTVTGMIHAAFWDRENIDYAQSDLTNSVYWARVDSLSTSNTVAGLNYRPGLVVDPTKAIEHQAGIAWVDWRNQTTNGFDIYFDSGALPGQPDDYFVYSTFHPPVGAICGIDGFVDAEGVVEGILRSEYIVFTGGPVYSGDITAYLYRVETAGDPDTHPDNPDNPGSIAARTFTQVSSIYLGNFASAHDNAFFIDETGIYYGASDTSHNGAPGWASFAGGAIWHWDFQWNLLECVVPTAAPAGTQTLTHNSWTGDWWVGTLDRAIYKWDGSSWVFQFVAPDLSGIHHDGLVIIENSLYVSDMSSHAIQQYLLDGNGELLSEPGIPYKTYYYTSSFSVEGMGFGPSHHIWASAGGSGVFELGGGNLQVNLEGIPDQCLTPLNLFESFDLNDYVDGAPPFTWTVTGGNEVSVTIDVDSIATVWNSFYFLGQEALIFTVEDGNGRLSSDQVFFTMTPMPVIGEIPDMASPIPLFNLDDYLLEGDRDLITWTASGMNCISINIDPITHNVLAEFPPGCNTPELITFTAGVEPCTGGMFDETIVYFDTGLSAAPNQIAVDFSLGRPTPNPCVSSTQVNYSLPGGGAGLDVSLTVYDLAGRRVQTLTGAEMAGGTGQVRWNCRDDRGQVVPSGVYFIRMNWGDKQASRRVVLIR